MVHPAFQVIRSTRTVEEADAVIATLRSAGFHPLDLESTSHCSTAGFDIACEIEVPREEAHAARELLTNRESLR